MLIWRATSLYKQSFKFAKCCRAMSISSALPTQDVCLYWDVENNDSVEDDIVRISIRPMHSPGGNNPSTLPILSSSQGEGPEENGVPNSVLQFERSLRKAQHAKKVGKEIRVEDLKVVYKDEYIIVVNKPPGVLTVPGLHSRASILTLIHAMFGNINTSLDRMIVHRLDMDTSGLVVFGLTAAITKELHAQFRDRIVKKEYECLVVGHLPSGEYLLDLPLQRDHKHPPFMRVSTPASELEASAVVRDLRAHSEKRKAWKHPQPKSSQTRILVVEQGMLHNDLPYTRLRLEPITGRTHQLRVHCAALGFPIVGDPTYGLYGEAAPCGGVASLPVINGPQRPNLAVQQEWLNKYRPNDQPMCLHAAFLQLKHPVSGEILCWNEAPEF